MTIGAEVWGEGPPVVALHGWTMRGRIWEPVARRLDATVHAPDLPGHGATTGYAPDIAGGVVLLGDYLAAHDLHDVTLVGWSLGALIGWAYLQGGSGRVARMVSLDMSPRPCPPPVGISRCAGRVRTRPRRAARGSCATGRRRRRPSHGRWSRSLKPAPPCRRPSP
ncbi:MAG: alpha/beta fold hydrolase [Rhodobacter sp.]|nr:alpha/beta fold hydrolase [Rhodobacter sp.]